MPTPFPANSVLEIRLVGELDGQQTLNIFHYVDQDGDPDVIATEGGYADAAEAQIWEGWLRGLVSGQYTLNSIDAQIISPTRFRSFSKVPANPNGPDLGNTIPSGGAVVVRTLTDKAGKKYRGRHYFAGPILTDVADSELTVAAVNAWKAGADAALAQTLATAVGNAASPIIWSPTHAGLTDFITGTKVDRVIRYQRRREVGVGV